MLSKAVRVWACCMGALGVHGALADTTSNLVARYTFNACNGKDATGRGNTGTLTGPAACIEGPQGDNAFQFNGTGNWFTVPSSADFVVENALTYSVWVRPDSLRDSTLLRKLTFAAEDKSLTLGSDGTVGFYLFNCMGGVATRTPKRIPAQAWTHIAATFDGAAARIYIDGALSVSKATTAGCNPLDSNGNVLIGGQTGPTSLYAGAMDDLRIYQRALSAADVLQLYRAVYPPQIAGTAPGERRTP